MELSQAVRNRQSCVRSLQLPRKQPLVGIRSCAKRRDLRIAIRIPLDRAHTLGSCRSLRTSLFGGAERAVAFYRDAFGAGEVSRIPLPDGRLMSVQLRIGDGMLHLADEFPEMGVLAPPSIGGTPVVLALDVADAEGVFAQAVTAGAQIRQPLADMFWGDRHGQLEDPFGHRWNIAQHIREVPHDEVVAAAGQAFT
jgi:PhnB protein